MENNDKSKTKLAHTTNQLQDENNPAGSEKYVLIGFGILAFGALIFYRLLGCSACYGASWLR